MSARVRVLVECPECGVRVPVNGIVDEVLCGGCQAVVKLGGKLGWDRIMNYQPGEGCVEHRVLMQGDTIPVIDAFIALNRRGPLELYRSRRGVKVEMDGKPITCASCRQELSLPELASELFGDGTAFCSGCSRAVPMRRATERERQLHSCIVGVIGETALRGDLDAPESDEAILFSCLGCGAPLTVDGSSPRTLTCEFCSASSFIPDALWLRMHPSQRKKPFWLLLSVTRDLVQAAKKRF